MSDKHCQEYAIKDVAALDEVAETLLAKLPRGGLLLLTGELGAGKTTFVQALARKLRVDQPVTSPTYNVVQKYPTHSSDIQLLVHADLYRLADSVNETEIAIQDVFEAVQPGALVAIEWADKLEKPFEQAVTMHFTHVENPTERHVAICFPTPEMVST